MKNIFGLLLLIAIGCHPISQPDFVPSPEHVQAVGEQKSLFGRLRVGKDEVILFVGDKHYWLDSDPWIVASFNGKNVEVDGWVWKEFVKVKSVKLK